MFECSEQINELAAAVAAAQGEMEAAIRGSVNPTFSSRYADLGAIRRACIPALAAHGVAVMQAATTNWLSESMAVVERPGHNGQPPRPEVRVVMSVNVTTRFVHGSGQWMQSTLSTLIADGTVWPMGSAITYLSRYGLAAMAGVALEDDDGVRANQARPAFEGARVRDQAAGRAMRAATTSPTIADAPTGYEAVRAAAEARGFGFAANGAEELEPAPPVAPRRSRGPSGGGNGGGTLAAPVAYDDGPARRRSAAEERDTARATARGERPQAPVTAPARRVLRDTTGQAMAEEAASPAITPQEANRLNRLLDAVGLTTRPEKMGWLEGQIGHSVSSLRHLTVREALACVTVLEEMVRNGILNATAPAPEPEEEVLPF